MLVRFLRGDDPNDGLAAPRVRDAVYFGFDAAKGHESQFAVVLAIIDPLERSGRAAYARSSGETSGQGARRTGRDRLERHAGGKPLRISTLRRRPSEGVQMGLFADLAVGTQSRIS